MLSHAAFISADTSATVDFYSGLLGMELVNAVLDDKIPSTGEDIPYFHSFFRMGDGSTIAFFEAPELPKPSADSHPAYATFRHFAMAVESQDRLDEWAAWLRANDVDVIGPVDHGIAFSIYFRDPDGNRLEFTHFLDERWNDRADEARAALDEWELVKAEAKASGENMAVLLRKHAADHSHTAGIEPTHLADE